MGIKIGRLASGFFVPSATPLSVGKFENTSVEGGFSFSPPWPGVVPAIFAPTVEARRAGTRPAVTDR